MGFVRQLSERHYLKRFITYILIYCMLFNLPASVVLAGPEGAEVIHGQVSLQQSGLNTVIHASDKSVINYTSFDIARPEVVQFIQPGSNASVLNRILSANPTCIDGTLLANGRVFFVNPAGVIIGSGATINVNQFVASGLNISNDSFINGQYEFVGGGGSVANYGDISAQSVYLVGKQVTNAGNINCPAGYVVMAAGDRVFLGQPGSNVIVEIGSLEPPNQADTQAPEEITNEGTVEAAGGTIILAAAGDAFSRPIMANVGYLSTSNANGDAGNISLQAGDGLIDNTGIITATSNSGTGGTITAVAGEVINTGTIDVSGTRGGAVALEATGRLGQFGTINADGIENDGGNINLTADGMVVLGKNSLTIANAGTNGDGGKVIAYSTNTALFESDAQVEAKGGSESGDGGFFEVSGLEYVKIEGQIDLSATNGTTGNFLIDPRNIQIVNELDLGTDPGWGDWDSTTGKLLATGDNTKILIFYLEGYLNTTNVIMSTGLAGSPGGSVGDITFMAGIDLTNPSNNSLTVIAYNDIIFQSGSGIDFGGSGNVTLQAGNNIDINSNISLNSGDFISTGIGFDNTGGAIITNDGIANIDHTGNVVISNIDTRDTIGVGGGSISIDGSSIIVNDKITAGTGAISFTSDSIDLSTTAENIVTTGTVTLQPKTFNTAIGIGGAAAAYQLDDAEIAAIKDGTSSITIGRSDGQHLITIDAITFNDPVTIQTPSGGSIMVNGQITGSDNASVTLDGPGATTTLNADIVTAGNPINISDTVEVGDGRTTLLDTTNGGAVGTGAGVTIQGALDGDTTSADGGESLTIWAGSAGTVQLQSTVGATQALDSLTITDSASTTISGSTNVGTVTLTDTTGTITFNGALTADTLNTAAQGYNVAINAGGTVTNPVTFSNTGTVTLGNDALDNLAFTGGVVAMAPSSKNVAGTVSAAGTGLINLGTTSVSVTDDSTIGGTSTGQITVGDAILADGKTLTLGAAAATPINTGPISGIAGGAASNLTFNTLGAVSVSGAVGTDIGTVTVTQSGGTTFGSTVDAITVTLTDTTGTIAFNGALTADTLNTASQGYNVAINAGGTVTNNVTFLNTGTVTLGNEDTDSITFTGGLDTTATSGTNIAGTVATTDTQMDLGATTMTADSTLKSGSGAINVASITDGASSYTLTLQDNTAASTGTVTFSDNVTISDLDTFSQAYAVLFQGTASTIDTDTTFLNTGGVTLGNDATDSIIFTGGLDTTAGSTNVAGTVATTDTQMDLGATTMTADSMLKSGSGAINVASITDGASSFSLDAGDGSQTGAITFSGNVTINDLDTFASGYDIAFEGPSNTIDTDTTFLNTGGVTLGNDATDSITFTGGLDTTAAGGTNIAGTVATTDTQMDLGATTMTADSTLKSGSGAINVDSITDVGNNYSLTLHEDNGSSTGAVTFIGNVTLEDLITFDEAHSVAMNGTTNTIDQDTSFINTGITTIGDGPGDSSTFTGGLDATTAGGVSIAGTIATTDQDIDLGAMTLTAAANLSTGTGGGSITFQNTLDGTTNLTENLTLTAGTGNINFDNVVGGITKLGDVTINSADDVFINAAFNANNIDITASDSTIDIGDDVTAAGDLKLNNNTTVADGKTLKAGQNLTMALSKTLTGEGDLALEATNGEITAKLITMTVDNKTLKLTQNNKIDMANFTVTDSTKTNLDATSTGSSVTSTTADQWQSITATAKDNIELSGSGNINIASAGLSSTSGGVKVVSTGGTISTPAAGGKLDAPINGSSDGATGVLLPSGGGKAAIVIMNKETLKLGSNAKLTANGTYGSVDDRSGIDFLNVIEGDKDPGNPVDVAVYLASNTGNINVNSPVTIGTGGAMVIDAYNTVEQFGSKFLNSLTAISWLEVCSRITPTLNYAQDNDTLPYADDPGLFPGTGRYVLRGEDPDVGTGAWVLAEEEKPIIQRKPIDAEVTSTVVPVSPDISDIGQVEDTTISNDLQWLGEELGLCEGDQQGEDENQCQEITQAYLAGAFLQASDMRPHQAAAQLRELAELLHDTDGNRIAALGRVINEFAQPNVPPSPEQFASISQVFTLHVNDGTHYAAAKQWLDALGEYTMLLISEIGWSSDDSVAFVMGKYGPTDTETGNISVIAFIQMHLEDFAG